MYNCVWSLIIIYIKPLVKMTFTANTGEATCGIFFMCLSNFLQVSHEWGIILVFFDPGTFGVVCKATLKNNCPSDHLVAVKMARSELICMFAG